MLGLTRERISEDVLAFDRGELAHFLAEACEHALKYYPIWFFMSRTGVRPSEARALKWEDLDAKRAVVQIARTFGFKDREGTPKTRRSRRPVDCSPALLELLRRLRRNQAETKLAQGWPELPAYCFTSSTGRPWQRREFERAFARVLRLAGLPAHHGPKSLRHTYASILLSEGTSLLYVSRQLGHTSSAITARVYTRWIPQPVPAVHRLDELAPAAGGNKLVANGAQVAETIDRDA